MAAGSRKDADEQPAFVFKGRVEQLARATMANVPVDERTAVVTVEQVLAAPESLAAYRGDQITVQLDGRGRVEAGQELIFHATPWMYGDGVAVRSLRHEPATTARLAAFAGARVAATRGGDEALRARLADADLVVAGRVKEVRLPQAAARTAVGTISEHLPDWREAVIEVADVIKGRHTRKSVVVRFPLSTDVRWRQAPKFEAGQEGYFLLHRAKAAGPRVGAARQPRGKATVLAARTQAYTALHPDDFQALGSDIETLVG